MGIRTQTDLHYRFDESTAARLERLARKYGLSRQGVLSMLVAQADEGQSYGSGQGSR